MASLSTCGGPARAERAGRHLVGVDADDGVDVSGGVPEGIGDMGGLDVVPFVVFRMRVIVVVEGRVGGSPSLFEAEGKAPKCLARAEERVGTGPVTDLFTAHRILLVTNMEGRSGDAIQVC